MSYASEKITTAYKAIDCLRLAVEPSIVSDVHAKIYIAITALQKERDDATKDLATIKLLHETDVTSLVADRDEACKARDLATADLQILKDAVSSLANRIARSATESHADRKLSQEEKFKMTKDENFRLGIRSGLIDAFEMFASLKEHL